ncbi:hypothetical protein SAMN06295909_1395 [Plantibacter sp. VKM Ac-1784]|uniref:Helix-turn-helix domain-containing protein n=1 Tax=Plantibacter elymi (nom. nud.) TaxID=199708 RepID=A0ABY1RAY4_9MICO|nr:hypothetical protein [Plantibacter sp. VKM Ac-1784]SMQ66989.1 hypothetical protein SAMN06295909_1395 [Plantibacter sp. VKM Ac-1784]
MSEPVDQRAGDESNAAYPLAEAEFIRPEFDFESEFAQFRNWWARDPRIVGNAFSLMLYLVTHRRTYRITQSRAQRDLGLGKDAFRAARRKLEAAGFLRVEEHRHPAGTVDAAGQSIAGHRRVLLILLDPQQPESATEGVVADTSAGFPPPLFDAWDESDSPSLRGTAAGAVSAADHVGSSSEAEPSTVLPPLKEHQSPEHQSSSTSPGLELAAQALHPRLSLVAVERWLAKHAPSVDVAAVDVLAASVDAIHGSSRPVGDPVAYVGRSISREPRRWPANAGESDDGDLAPPGPRRIGNRPPTVAECSADGHRFVGTFREVCGTCGEERPDWRKDRDRE